MVHCRNKTSKRVDIIDHDHQGGRVDFLDVGGTNVDGGILYLWETFPLSTQFLLIVFRKIQIQSKLINYFFSISLTHALTQLYKKGHILEKSVLGMNMH